jgi:glycosyltransferase involved in cell wall biosynthesis
MLSIAINVKNGAKHIERCLDALVKFDDVVILDNHSTDATVQLASKYPNVRLFVHDFLGMGRVRNLLATYAKYEWVLFVDCDEVLSSRLTTKLLKMSFKDRYIYSIKRHNFFANSFVDSSSWENDWVLRLYNKTQTKYTESDVHESVVINGLHIEKINSGFIYHFPYENVAQLIDKMQFYSTLYAKQNLGKKSSKLYLLPFRAFAMFIKCYVLKRGFMDGYEGLVISSFNAMGVFSKYIKLYELSYNKKIAMALVVNDMDNLEHIINNINAQTLIPAEILVFTNTNDDKRIKLLSDNLKSLLIVKSVVLSIGSGTINDSVLSYIGMNKNYIDNVIYISLPQDLSDSNLFKRCKIGLLNNKQTPNIKTWDSC